MSQKILMVDDSRIACTLMRLELMPFGYQVVTAETVEEAFAKLRDDPDLRMVVLDFSVAELLGGRELVRKLRDQSPRRHLPVILHSAIQDDELRERALALGADGAYRKGGRLLELVQKIGSLCESRAPVEHM